MADNRISVNFTAEQSQAAHAMIDELTKALPFLLVLTPEERQRVTKLSDKAVGFTRKAHDIALQHPDIMPRSFDLAEFTSDLELYERLITINHQLKALQTSVEDTLMVAGGEAYVAALLVYRMAKEVRKDGELKAEVDDLAQRFARKLEKVEGETK